MLSRLLPDDLHHYGMIPEFVGRFPVSTYVEPLDKKDLVRILTEPSDAVITQYQQLLAMDGIDLKFTKGALEAIAETALKIGTGARALRCVIEKVMRDVMFDAPSRKTSGTKEFVVTEPLVNNKITQFLNVG